MKGYSIGQAAEKTGLSPHTLRYYEKEGLLPFLQKSASGLRVFSQNDLNWLAMIECLKETGMPIKGIKQYIDWFIEGDNTLPQRLDMFKLQEKKIKEQLMQLQKKLDNIRYKIKIYKEAVLVGSLEKAHQNKEIEEEGKKVLGTLTSPSEL